MPEESLEGRKQIADFVERDWRTISRWIKDHSFPATKIGGTWQSDAELIRQWRKKQVAV